MSRAPVLAACIAGATLAGVAHGATPADLEAAYARAAGAAFAPAPERGRALFASRHGRDWSCSTCHTDDPRAAGRHTVTGRPLRPLAPSANPERFTDGAKVEKWFTRNCRDVLGRECTSGEKADVIAFLRARA
jgi:cytochrome c peroxidase